MTLLGSFDISEKAIGVHGKRMDLTAKNIANIDTPNYVRKIPVINATDNVSFAGLLSTMKDDMFGGATVPFVSGGVSLTGMVEDPTLGDKIYRPGHPDADENGYIRTSNVNALVEFADAAMAQRAYEASLGVMKITKEMIDKAIDIGG
jgi:flagellar basal-body rod protein FlgC